MHRTYPITLPADTNYHSIWDSLITAGIIDNLGQVIVSNVSTTEIVTDRVCELQIQSQAAGGQTISISDRAQTGTPPTLASTAAPFIARSSRNSICLRDYFVKGSANSQGYTVTMESI